MDGGFAPDAAAVVLVGADAELVRRVGLQVVDHGVAGRAGLIDPLPVPLPVADGVEPEDNVNVRVRGGRGSRSDRSTSYDIITSEVT